MRVAYCNTHLNYVRGNDYEPVETTIYDARASQQALDFDECGFILINHRSKVTDWNDTIQLNTFHCSEMADVAREFTGCRNAVAYLTESLHGAGSPQTQRIQIRRKIDIEEKKDFAKILSGINERLKK